MRTNSLMAGCLGLMGLVVALVIPSPASSATIYQCAHKVNGQLRVVSAPSDCLPSENAIGLSIPIIVHGSVTFPGGGAPGIVVTNAAIGFSLERIQPGQYAATFDSAFPSAPDCQATALNPPVNVIGYCTTITPAATTGVGIACRFFDSTGASLRDQDFTLMCVLAE
jgi:hypothetical protein